MTPLLIKSALWVLFFETLQNIPAMIGMVFALSEKTWKRYLYALLGMIACALVIAALERTKLLGTTITKEAAPDLVNVLIYGFEMGVAAWIYLFLTQWGNKYTDALIGLILAVIISVSTFKPEDYWSLRFFSHTAAFALTSVLLLSQFRLAKNAVTFEEKIGFIIRTTLIMSITIAWTDYAPFLKR